MARRLDRDGVRLEQYTKAHKQIPIGSSVAVQNQTGRFPNKWDKTGMVVENLDHDKVLVKLDGSGRLTTRNRQFVKRIVSAPDQPVEVLSVLRKSQGIRDDSRVDLLPEEEGAGQLISGAGDPVLAREVEQLDDEGPQGPAAGHEVVEGWDEASVGEGVVPVGPAEVPDQAGQPAEGRPVRARKPNVRYSAEEYDLSQISGTGRARYQDQGWKKRKKRK